MWWNGVLVPPPWGPLSRWSFLWAQSADPCLWVNKNGNLTQPDTAFVLATVEGWTFARHRRTDSCFVLSYVSSFRGWTSRCIWESDIFLRGLWRKQSWSKFIRTPKEQAAEIVNKYRWRSCEGLCPLVAMKPQFLMCLLLSSSVFHSESLVDSVMVDELSNYSAPHLEQLLWAHGCVRTNPKLLCVSVSFCVVHLQIVLVHVHPCSFGWCRLPTAFLNH